MCGRFALLAPGPVIAEQFGVSVAHEIAPRYNIAPTQPVAAVRLDGDGERELTYFQWGLIPSWAKDPAMGSRLINARSETAAEKPSFRAAYKRRHCLLPASGFYEWRKLNGSKQPTYIRPIGDELFGLAGLWEIWYDAEGSELQTCTILTTGPNELMEPIHNRMPVIIDPDDYSTWLDAADYLDQAQHLLRPYPSDRMQAYSVSTAVNNPRNESAENIRPLDIV
ncbi:MAG: SOS response-associated peptidase [Candidatus Promineifilaceae bacterium]|jgi:putative SOS response-associated peptidase YedK